MANDMTLTDVTKIARRRARERRWLDEFERNIKDAAVNARDLWRAELATEMPA